MNQGDSHHRFCGMTLVVIGIVFLMPAGCASDGRSVNASSKIVPQAGHLAPGVDAERGLATLDELTPKLEVPRKPADLGPLSPRSQRQVTRATDLIAQQRFTEASIALERALRFDPDHPVVHRALATLHWRAGNIERARTHASRALEGNPDDAVAEYVYGRCQLRDGLKESAMVAFRTALLCSDFQDDPETAALTHYHLAELLRESGYLSAALKEYDRFADVARRVRARGASTAELSVILSGGRTATFEARANILEKLGRLAEAADNLGELVAVQPDDTSLGRRYVRLLAGAGRYSEALAAARKVPAFDDEFISLLILIYAKVGRPDGVVDDLRDRLSEQPHIPQLVMTLADVLVKTNRSAEAIDALRQFVSANKDAHEVRSRLVDMLLGGSQWSQALSVCADGIRIAPDRFDVLSEPIMALASDPRAVDAILADATHQGEGGDHHIDDFLRGSLALSVGRKKDAETFLKKSNAGAPDFLPTRIALARLYLKQYRYDEALQLIAPSEDETPSDNVALELVRARIYDRLDDRSRALRHYSAVVQLDRQNTEALYAMAQLHLRFHEPLKAQQSLRLLLEQQPERDDARELLAEAYVQGEKRDLAIQTYKDLQKRTKSVTVAARCRVRLDPELIGDPQAQRAVLLAALDQGPPDAETWIAVAQTYSIQQQDQRRAAFEKALALDPEQVDIAYWLALSDRSLLDFESCTHRLEALLRRNPNRHAWRHQLIIMYVLLFEDDKALALATEPLTRESLPLREREAYRSDVEDILEGARRNDELIRTLREWSESHPDDSELKHRLGSALLRLKHYAQAAQVFAELLSGDSTNRQYRQELVVSLREAGRAERAEQKILDWLEDDPRNDHTVSLLASHFVLLKRFDEAFVLTQAHLEQTSNREWYQGFWLRALNAEKRYSDGVELAEHLLDTTMRVLRAGPEMRGPRWRDHVRYDEIVYYPNAPFRRQALEMRAATLQLQLATELVFDKKYQRAEKNLNGWLEATTEPRLRGRILLLLATCFTRQGHLDKAADAMQRAQLLAPQEPTRSNDLAYQWIDRGIRLDEAEPLIRQALGRIPTNPAYLDTFGWLLYKKGAFADARKWLRRADRARVGGDPVILDHLGDACWRFGAVDEAIQHWSAAVGLVADRDDDQLVNDDERRVKSETSAKIEAARSNKMPGVAPLGVESQKTTKKNGES